MHNRSYVNGHEGHLHYLSGKTINSLKKKFRDKRDEEALIILKNLSDPTKFCIYMLLHEVDEIPVTDIVTILNLTQSSVSHALSDLKKLGLVESNRCGQLVCYSLKKQPKKRESLLSVFGKLFYLKRR